MLLALYGRIWNMVEHKNVLHLLGSPRFEINHSNEVLNIDFGQGAAKIPGVKVGGQKKYLPSGRVRTHAVTVGLVGRYFFHPPTLTPGIFAAP